MFSFSDQKHGLWYKTSCNSLLLGVNAEYSFNPFMGNVIVSQNVEMFECHQHYQTYLFEKF